MKRVKRFGVFQTAKVAGVIYFLLSLVFIIPVWLFSQAFSAVIPEDFGFSGGILLFLPFLYGAAGFISVAIICAIYNLVAGWIGGIEVEIEDAETEAGTYARTSAPHM